MNKDKPLRLRSYSNRKIEEPAGRNPNRQIRGGRGKKHNKPLVNAMLNRNLDIINQTKASWKKGYKGLNRTDQKKMKGCINEGEKSVLNKGYACDTCCDNKFKGGENNTICKNRCKTKFPDGRIINNPMLSKRVKKYRYQDLKF